jgi:hypothetical protein
MNPIHRGKVEQGKKIYDNPSRYLVQLSKLEGKRFEEVIRREKSKRSLNQNSAYWGIAIEILSECESFGGYTKEEIHDALRKEFLSKVDPNTGLTKIRSTTDLNTIEFNEYYATIQRWASSFLNIYIPDPNEIPGYEVAL